MTRAGQNRSGDSRRPGRGTGRARLQGRPSSVKAAPHR